MTSFTERQKSLFNHLKNAEDQISFSKFNKAETPHDYGVVDRRQYRKLKHEMKQFRGKESIFKRPEQNITQCLRAKGVPQYMKHPQKWVYYSLSDVTQDQMSDSTNSATAHAFIRELENREAAKARMESDYEGPEEFVFKKPIFHISATMKNTPEADTPKAVFKSSKIIMPEYVVGRAPKKERKVINKNLTRDNSTIPKNAELKLNHLYEDDEYEQD